MNPDSFPELSFHARLIWLWETVEAVSSDGAGGGAGRAWSEAAKSRFKAPSSSGIQMEKERVAPIGSAVLVMSRQWRLNVF